MAKKYNIEVDVDVKGEQKVEKLNESLGETQEEQEGVNEGFSDMGSTADAALGGMAGAMLKFKSSVTASIKSLGVMKVAIAATGLGALLLLITSIKTAFTNTEEGQDKFNKLMSALGVITGNLVDLLGDLGTAIISAFENPKQALEGFWEALKNNVVVRVNSVVEMFGYLGDTIKSVFEGDWDGAMESAKNAGLKYVDAMTGIENSVDKATDAVSGFIEETKNEINTSNELSDLQANLDRRIREQLVNRAKLEGEISDARLKAYDDETYSLEERIALLQEGQDKNDEIFAEEEAIARDRLRIAQERNKMSGSTKEDLDAEAQLESQLIRITKQRADAQKFMFAQQAGLRRQANAQKEADAKADKDRLEQEKKDREKAQAEEQKKLKEHLKKLAEIEAANWKNLMDHMGAVGLDRLGMLAEVIQDMIAKVKESGKIGTVEIMAITSAALSAAAQLVNGIANQIDTSTREGFEKQKKLRIAAATMDTFAAIIAGMLAGLSTGSVWGIALGAATAAAAGALGYKQVQAISSTQFGGGTSIGGAGQISTPSIGGGVVSSPSFSQVSPLTAGEEQLSSAIGQETAEPTKAYVVSSEMTTNQELDRHIETNAGL